MEHINSAYERRILAKFMKAAPIETEEEQRVLTEKGSFGLGVHYNFFDWTTGIQYAELTPSGRVHLNR